MCLTTIFSLAPSALANKLEVRVCFSWGLLTDYHPQCVTSFFKISMTLTIIKSTFMCVWGAGKGLVDYN